jgi:hypothetical protein
MRRLRAHSFLKRTVVEDFGWLLSTGRAVPVHFVDAVTSVVASNRLLAAPAFNGEDHGVVNNLAPVGPELHVEDDFALRIEFALVGAAHVGISRSTQLALDLHPLLKRAHRDARPRHASAKRIGAQPRKQKTPH